LLEIDVDLNAIGTPGAALPCQRSKTRQQGETADDRIDDIDCVTVTADSLA
jgi:hypothetical protein